jgi:hypothetical protein
MTYDQYKQARRRREAHAARYRQDQRVQRAGIRLLFGSIGLAIIGLIVLVHAVATAPGGDVSQIMAQYQPGQPCDTPGDAAYLPTTQKVVCTQDGRQLRWEAAP